MGHETSGLSTRISVPARHARRMMDELTRAGFIVLDRGERITTEDGLQSEASLDLVLLPSGS